MANVTIKTMKTPRHAYFRQVAAAVPPHGGTIRDQLLEATINKDAYQTLFDDFHGDSLHDMYTACNSTGATTCAASTAILASTASNDKYAGFTGGDLGWFGGKNCMFQTRCKISSTAFTETKYEFGWHGAVAGSAGLFNDIAAPSWVGTTAGVLFGYDSDDTAAIVWKAGAYSSAAPKKRDLYNTGTSTAAAATTLTQATYTWIVNAFGGLWVTAGTAPNLTRAKITTNTATVLTHTGWSNGTPAAASTYVISNFYEKGTASDSPTIPHLDKYHTYTIKIEQLMALFYIDGVQVAAIPAAVAATTTGLTPWFFAQARGTGAVDASLTVDYLQCIQSRDVTA